MGLFKKEEPVGIRLSPELEFFLMGIPECDQIPLYQLQRILDLDTSLAYSFSEIGQYQCGVLKGSKVLWLWTSPDISLPSIWNLQQQVRGLPPGFEVLRIYCKPEISAMLLQDGLQGKQKLGISSYACTALKCSRVDLHPSKGRLVEAKASWMPQLVRWYNEASTWLGYPIKSYEQVHILLQQLIISTTEQEGLFVYSVGDTPVGFGIIGLSLPTYRAIQFVWIDPLYSKYGYQERIVYYLAEKVLNSGYSVTINVQRTDYTWNEIARVLGFVPKTALDCLQFTSPVGNTRRP